MSRSRNGTQLLYKSEILIVGGLSTPQLRNRFHEINLKNPATNFNKGQNINLRVSSPSDALRSQIRLECFHFYGTGNLPSTIFNFNNNLWKEIENVISSERGENSNILLCVLVPTNQNELKHRQEGDC